MKDGKLEKRMIDVKDARRWDSTITPKKKRKEEERGK